VAGSEVTPIAFELYKKCCQHKPTFPFIILQCGTFASGISTFGTITSIDAPLNEKKITKRKGKWSYIRKGEMRVKGLGDFVAKSES